MADALVLAGAAAMGAFTAGALSVLSRPDVQARLNLDITRVVGSSAGALNGAYVAAAIRSGTVATAGPKLVDLWLRDATLLGVFDLDVADIAALRGLSSDNKVVALLREQIPPGPSQQAVQLHVVVTNADGAPTMIEGEATTSYEQVVDFTAADFETQEALERVFVTVAASAALPLLYSPVALELGGHDAHGVDGGLVNDTPLAHALAGAPEVERVFVVVPAPRVQGPSVPLHGLALASRLLEILITERLVRDLRHAARVNRVLDQLPALVPDPAARAALLEALGWSERRKVQIIEIRPEHQLPGNGLSGLTSRTLRQQYVEAGAAAAERVLSALRSS